MNFYVLATVAVVSITALIFGGRDPTPILDFFRIVMRVG